SGLDLREVEDVVDQPEEMLSAGMDLLEEPLACGRWELTVAGVDQQLREPENGVERRAQLVAHARQEHALVTVRIEELAVALLELHDQMPPIERGRECAHGLLDPADLVRSEGGSEGPRRHNQGAGAREAFDRQ